jgi:putative peptide zinc metalloprotease protein
MDQAPEQRKVYTGTPRRDLQFYRGPLDHAGIPTWSLYDPVSDIYYRLSEENYHVIAALTSNMELDDFLAKLKSLGMQLPRKKVMSVLVFLSNHNLLQPIYGQTEARVAKQKMMKKKMLGTRILSNYLFFRLPLVKPDKFLNRTADMVHFIFNRWMLTILVLLAVCGYICLVTNWQRVAEQFINALTFQGLVRYSLAVIIIKCIHEFCHAYTAKAYGIRVRRFGVAFIFFFPRLFTDLTDSWRLSSRKQRFMIDSAGIISEIVIGGIAALLWANAGPGAVRSICYYIFTVSILNTALVNGNPFIKYDGYFILCDILGMDNLQSRSAEILKRGWRRILFGIEMGDPDPMLKGTGRFLAGLYGVCAFVYRLFLYTSIILIVYFQFTKTLGIILLISEVYLLLFRPFYMEVKTIMHMSKKIRRANLIGSLIGFLIIVLIIALPLPWNLTMPCEVKPGESAVIYAQIDGYLNSLKVQNGERILKGQPIFSQENPYLEWAHREAYLDKLLGTAEFDLSLSNVKTMAEGRVLWLALQNNIANIEELARKKSQLNVVNPLDGNFALYDLHLKEGKWLRKGEVIGEVVDSSRRKIVAYVRESDYKGINPGIRTTVALRDQLARHGGTVTYASPLPALLPASPLLDIFGGPVPSMPAEGTGLYQPLEPYYMIEIEPDRQSDLPIGRSGTVWLKRYSSIGGNALRAVLSVLQKELTF